MKYTFKQLYDYCDLIKRNAMLVNMVTYYETNLKHNVVADAYYILTGSDTTLNRDNSIEYCWGRIVDSVDFPKLVAMCVDYDSTLNAVFHLSVIFLQTFCDYNNMQKASGKNSATEKVEKAEKDQQLAQEMILQGNGDDNANQDSDQEGESEGKGKGKNQSNKQGNGQGNDPYNGNLNQAKAKGQMFDLKLDQLQALNEAAKLVAGLFAGVSTQPTLYKKERVVDNLTNHVNVAQFIKMLGSINSAASAAQRDTKAMAGVTVDLLRGDFNKTTLPREKMLVAAGVKTALAKFTDNSFNNRKMEITEPSGMGSFFIARDESGSMLLRTSQSKRLNSGNKNVPAFIRDVLDPSRGDNDESAFSLEVALAAIAKRQGRNVVAFPFDSASYRVFDYQKQPYSEFVEHSKKFFGGGTRITHVLLEMLKQVTKGTDIVIFTDGYIEDNPLRNKTCADLLDKWRKQGLRIWVVYIGSDYAELDWADHAIHVSSLLSNDPELLKMFRTVGTDRSEGRRQL